MTAILISIQPQHLANIFNLIKWLEMRKSAPNCELPIDVYLYCTKGDIKLFKLANGEWVAVAAVKKRDIERYSEYSGKVVGKFTLKEFDRVPLEAMQDAKNGIFNMWNDFELNKACLHQDDLYNYANGKDVSAWHIDDLVIFDKPMELSEFDHYHKDWHRISCACSDQERTKRKCGNRNALCGDESSKYFNYRHALTRPPQSWQYVDVQNG